jgi:hypothetical protein
MNPIAFMEAAAATHSTVLGALEDPVVRRRTAGTRASRRTRRSASKIQLKRR